MKIDRYQGYISRSGEGEINDHQHNECIIAFKHVPKNKKDEILNTCLEILNREDIFNFDKSLRDKGMSQVFNVGFKTYIANNNININSEEELNKALKDFKESKVEGNNEYL